MAAIKPAASSVQDLLEVFERKLLPSNCLHLPLQERPADRPGPQPFHQAADLFETCLAELQAPAAVHCVALSGASDCWISSPAIHHSFPKSYTACIWIRLDSNQRTRDITVFRARASNLCSTECSVSLGEAHSDTHSRVEFRVKINHRDVQTVGGRINLEADMAWHLVTVVHKYKYFPFHGTVTVLIDGEIAMERELDYPFKPLSALSDSIRRLNSARAWLGIWALYLCSPTS